MRAHPADGRRPLDPGAELSASIYIDNLVRYHPSYIAGVPTLFQALLANPKFARVRFETLRGACCGGDSLTSSLKHRFDEVLAAQGASVELMEGYGLTECVTSCTVSPSGGYREDSIGIPIPGMRLKVVDPVAAEDVGAGVDGELCVTGPTLMVGYLNEPEATAETLRTHPDGRVWLHTGDIGSVDEDGYFYFKGRQKRVIKVSGVSVYPAQVEQVLESLPGIARACVIGTPDEYQMTSVKAFVVPVDGVGDTPAFRAELTAHCRRPDEVGRDPQRRVPRRAAHHPHRQDRLHPARTGGDGAAGRRDTMAACRSPSSPGCRAPERAPSRGRSPSVGTAASTSTPTTSASGSSCRAPSCPDRTRETRPRPSWPCGG